MYRYCPGAADALTFVRFLFRGEIGERLEGELDQAIIVTELLSYEEVNAGRAQHRGPMVMRCIDDFPNGTGYPSDVTNQEFA